MESIVSTSFAGRAVRAVVGRQEVGHYLAIEIIEHGKTEGDPASLVDQRFVDLSPQTRHRAAQVAILRWEGRTLVFSLRTPRRRLLCQLPDATERRARVRCSHARGTRPPKR